jgi:peptidoglycan-associated lipoprotein
MSAKLANLFAATMLASSFVGAFEARAADIHFAVYFEEWSARLSPDAQSMIAQAAGKAKELGTPIIRVEGRASAVGSAATNKLMAETRTSIVTDELQHDGVAAANIHQVPIGQTGSGDPGVTDRRVDIIIEGR